MARLTLRQSSLVGATTHRRLADHGGPLLPEGGGGFGRIGYRAGRKPRPALVPERVEDVTGPAGARHIGELALLGGALPDRPRHFRDRIPHRAREQAHDPARVDATSLKGIANGDECAIRSPP